MGTQQTEHDTENTLRLRVLSVAFLHKDYQLME